MGQVPAMTTQFLLVGRGRLARHFDHVLTHLLKTEPLRWDRSMGLDSLRPLAEKATHVGLAVSDSAIAELCAGPLANLDARLVHFSGATSVPGVASAHPLMSFGPELFADDVYGRIHFAVTGAESLSELLPDWPNPWFRLSDQDKALYHAWCVMAGNFPVILWERMESEFAKLGCPPEAGRLYVRQVAENFFRTGPAALTGPLVRGDQVTIEKNLAALGTSSWAELYRSFLEVRG